MEPNYLFTTRTAGTTKNNRFSEWNAVDKNVQKTAEIGSKGENKKSEYQII